MYHGKHVRIKQKNRKPFILLAALLLIFTVTAGSTLAYLITSSGPVENVFTPGQMGGNITENFDGTTKSDVSISITGDADAYVRAAIVVTWKDAAEDGNIYGKQPVKGTDYSMSLNTLEWFDGGDGYYYCKSKVVKDGSSPVLIKSCSQIKACENPSYKLDVEIIAEAIQAVPKTAVTEAWGKTIADQLN